MLRFHLVAVSAAVLSFASGCGGPTQPEECGPQTCNGCCDATGTCQGGSTPQACGIFGGACQQCAAGCQGGVCRSPLGGGSGGGSSSGGGTATGGGAATGGGVSTGGGGTQTGGGSASGGGIATGGGTQTGGGAASGGGVASGGGGGSALDGDTCNNPTALTFNAAGTAIYSADNTSYGNDGQGSCGDSRDHVFSFTLSESTELSFEPGSGILASHLRSTCGSSSTEQFCAGGSTTRRTLAAGTWYLWVEASGIFNFQINKVPGDSCESASTLTFSAGTATISGSLANYSNDFSSNSCIAGNPDRMYRFTTTAVQDLSLGSTISGTSTSVSIVSLAGGCSGGGDEVRCDSVGSASAGDGIRIATLPAGSYGVWVRGYLSTTYALELKLTTPVVADSCGNAQELTFSGDIATVTTNVSSLHDDTSVSYPCSFGSGSPDAVYSFTLTTAQLVNISVTGTGGYTPGLGLRTSCIGTEQYCVYPSTSSTPSLSKLLQPGTYFVWVDGDSSTMTTGSFTLSVQKVTTTTTAVDACSTATSPVIASSGTVTVTGTLSTTSFTNNYTNYSSTCTSTTYAAGPDVVYVIQHPVAGAFQATVSATSGSSIRPVLYLRSACSTASSEVSCGGSGCSSTSAQIYNSSLAAGTYYLILDTCGSSYVGGYSLSVSQ